MLARATCDNPLSDKGAPSQNTQGNDVKDASTSSDAVEESGPTLHRGLQNRHIQLIALGGAIGTGLFLALVPRFKWLARRCCWVTPWPVLSLF